MLADGVTGPTSIEPVVDELLDDGPVLNGILDDVMTVEFG